VSDGSNTFREEKIGQKFIRKRMCIKDDFNFFAQSYDVTKPRSRSKVRPVPSPEVPSLQICGQTALQNNQWQASMKYFPCSYWFTQKKPVVFYGTKTKLFIFLGHTVYRRKVVYQNIVKDFLYVIYMIVYTSDDVSLF
jgi:hypothetical protein